MSITNTMQIFLPLINPSHDGTAFPVARYMASTLSARLHIVASSGQSLGAPELAQRLSVPSEEMNTVETDKISGDLVTSIIRMIDASQNAMIILPVRVRDDMPKGEAQTTETIKRQLLEQATCPILIVPPDRDMHNWRLQRELLPQDGTPESACALAKIIDQSTQLGIENLVLRVAGANIGQPTEPGSLATPRYVDHPQYDWDAWGHEFLDRICGLTANLDASSLRLLMATGEPAVEVLRVAEEQAVDMIVLPWHCTLGSGRACMVKAVLHEASCPVLLLPEGSIRCHDKERLH